MENRDYEKILNAMPETGVYVIREADKSLLYFNKRVQEVSPGARLGVACHEVWAGSCNCCPLLTIGDRQESRSVSYNDPYGGVVDITATRTLWEGSIPAFVLTVAPRVGSGGYTYRKILYADLDQDAFYVLKSDPEGWEPKDGPLSKQLAEFAGSGAIYPGDREHFAAFTQLEQLRALPGQQKSMVYRSWAGDNFRWNLMEVVPDPAGGSGAALICVKDIHDILREGLEREGLTLRGQELIRSLGERNFNIYTIDLSTGTAEAIRVDGQMRGRLAAEDWEALLRTQLMERLHEAYRDEFGRRFSLEGLRLAKEEGQQKSELLCQWQDGEGYRYISATAYFSRDLPSRSYTVLALQDVDEQTRRELAHTQRDMQMAAILKSRFRMMNTVHLDSGLCERMDLTRAAGPENTLLGDYAAYIQSALSTYVHPDDREVFRSSLSLEHLRERAESVEDYADDICQYRLRGEPARWIELHVLYSRQGGGQVMVNILGQEITREKRQEESRLQALADRADIISSLTHLFFSTYYINVENDSFRAVTQLRRVEDVLGEEVNCTAALQIYANHFIHPDDRAEYLRVMNVKNLRETLRWWKPYVAVEYRKVPDDPDAGPDSGGWIRATAVLARTGEDELPKTVVYVAQDITGNSRRAG